VDPGKKELMELAGALSINNANATIDEIKSIINEWRKYAELSGVSKTSTDTIENSLNAIRSRF